RRECWTPISRGPPADHEQAYRLTIWQTNSQLLALLRPFGRRCQWRTVVPPRRGKEGPPRSNRGGRWATTGPSTNLRTTPGAAEGFAESDDAHGRRLPGPPRPPL